MTEKAFNAIFAKNLKNLLRANGMSQKELANKLSVGTSSVSSWCRGEKSPRMDKVDAICEIFKCTRADLIEETTNRPDYYLNDKTRKIAQEVYDNPELQILFDASRDLEPKDVEFVVEMINRMKKGDD